MVGVREIELNGADWGNPDDLYDSFFAAVGAPPWHGRNFNALADSIATGQINAVEVPYRIVIKNVDLVRPEARQIASDFISLIRELAERGCPVEMQLVESHASK